MEVYYKVRKKEKQSACYIGPYEIIKRIGATTYQLALLPPELSKLNEVFHVSMLRKNAADPLMFLRHNLLS